MSIQLENLPVTIEEIRKERSRRNLLPFTLYTFEDYEVNWHHEEICSVLDRWAFGDLQRLMIFAPPRYGKSELVSRRLPALIFGKNPDARIMSASYAADLAQRNNRDVQRIIDSPNYRNLFPETNLAGSEIARAFGAKALRNTDLFEIVGHKGTYVSAGVGGAITGMGFDYGIIDDPYKNRAEANSRAIRENIWEWFTSTFYTRQEKDAKLLLMMTRWHESDLAGHIKFMMDNDPDFEKWTILSYSAVAEQDIPARNIKAGDPLWPGKYSLQSLNNTKAMLGSYEWNALYQQHPSPLEGGVFNRKWWKYYRAADLPQKFDVIIQSWDMAFKGTDQSDYVVGGIWGKIGADRYLLDLVRGKMTFTDTIRAVKELSSRWPNVQAKVIEDKANGTAVIDTLKKEITGLIPFNPKGSKIERANAVSPMVESGNVYLPIYKPWTQDFVEELTSFPNGANDDQVDMFTQAMLRLDKHKGLRILNKRSFNL